MHKRSLALLAGALLSSGCATMGPDPEMANVDTLQVARVEAAAKSMGVKVYWVNFPQKSAAQIN